jgi:serine/threonine-protein kinase
VGKNSAVDLVVSAGVQTVTVPQLQGLSLQAAKSQLEQNGLKVGTVTQSTQPSTSAPGTVLNADPAPGQTEAIGTSVNLTVVSEKVPVPDVRGQNENQARSTLAAYGFSVITTSQSSSQPTGTVLAQSPAPNSSQDRDATITLTISQKATPSPTPTPTPTGSPTGTPTTTPTSPGNNQGLPTLPTAGARGKKTGPTHPVTSA